MDNQEFGAILPNNQTDPLEAYQNLQRQQVEQSRYNQQMQAQKDNRDFQLIKYLGDTLDPSHYGTGTPYDSKINNGLSDIWDNATQMIKDKKSPADVAAYTMMGTNRLNNWATKVKGLDERWKNEANTYSKTLGIDPNAYYKYVKAYALHDDKGNLKDIDQLDTNYDYGADLLQKHPDQFSTDDRALGAYIKGSEKHPIKSSGSVNVGGVKRNVGYGGEIYSDFNVGVDSNGKPIDPNDKTSLITGVKVKSENIPIDDKGNTLEVADRGVYNHLKSDPAINFRLNAIARGNGVDPDSPQGELVKRRYLFNYLNNSAKGYMYKEKDDVDQSQLQREQFAQQMQVQREENKRQEQILREQNKKEEKPNFAETMGKYYSGDMKDGDVDENGNINISSLLPGGVLNSGKQVLKEDGKPVLEPYSSIKFNPTTGSLIPYKLEYQYNKDGERITKNGKYLTKEVADPEITDPVPFIRKIATVNGLSPDEAEKAFRKHYDNSAYKIMPKPKPWINRILGLK